MPDRVWLGAAVGAVITRGRLERVVADEIQDSLGAMFVIPCLHS